MFSPHLSGSLIAAAVCHSSSAAATCGHIFQPSKRVLLKNVAAHLFAFLEQPQRPSSIRGEPVTLAAVQPPPVAMDDSYTGPAPSAYEAQAANYR